MGVGETFQIFNFFNIYTKDFHILHNKERQEIDVLLLFLKKFLFGSMAISVQKMTQHSKFMIHNSRFTDTLILMVFLKK